MLKKYAYQPYGQKNAQNICSKYMLKKYAPKICSEYMLKKYAYLLHLKYIFKRYNMKIHSYSAIYFLIGTIWQGNALIPSRGTKLTVAERMKYLDLVWKIREEMDICDVTKEDLCGHMCHKCDGEGELMCRFCGGTGFLMMGNELIGTDNDCPVCKGSGYEECKHCMGAGYVVDWREEYD